MLARRFWLIVIFIPCMLVLTFLTPLRFAWAIFFGKDKRSWEILQGMDRLGNAIGNGDSSEFISTRANRAARDGKRWGCVLCKLLDKVDPGHCAASPVTKEYADTYKSN